MSLSLPCSASLGRLPVEEIQDDFGHAGGELEVEFRGGTGAVALCEPSPDEQQEHGGSQHASDAHGCDALGMAADSWKSGQG